MNEMKTDDLLKALSQENCKINDFLRKNDEEFVNEDIKTFWDKLIDKSGFSKSNIINRSDFNYRHFYDCTCGRKMPTKDKVVRLALAMKLSIEECQEALKISGRAPLYPRIRRDSILIYAVEHHLTILKCNEMLGECGEGELK